MRGSTRSIAGIRGQVRRPGEEGKVVDPRGEREESQLFFWRLFPTAKLLVITRVTNQLGCGGPRGGIGIPNKNAHQITKETFESQALPPYLLFEGLFSCPSPEKLLLSVEILLFCSILLAPYIG